MLTNILAIAIAAILLSGIMAVQMPILASNGNEDEGNGNDHEEAQTTVIVEQGDNTTEVVLNNNTVVVSEQEFQVTNESVTVGACECPAVEPTPEPEQPAANETEQPAPTEVPVVDENQTTEPDTNVTVPVEEPQAEPAAINIALIEDIQRGHNQHVTAFIIDEQGNEFTNETVSLEVVNARDRVLRETSATSGEEVVFKVGPNTAPQVIEVKATSGDLSATADYEVFPKGQQPTPEPELPVEPTPVPIPEPGLPTNITGPVSADVTGIGPAVSPNATLN